MDLGTLVAAIQIKDTDFERVLTKAAQTAKTTEQKVQQALSHIEMDVDASSFERSMSEAPKAAKDAGKQITQALGDVGQVLAEQTRAVQDNARAWAQNRLDPARIQELKQLGVATDDYIQAISGIPSAQSKVRSALDGNSAALKTLELDTRAVADAQKDFDRTISQIIGTLDKQSGAVSENTRVWAANKIGDDNLRVLEQLGVKTSEYVDAVVGVPGALQQMQTALDGNGDALSRLNTLTGQVSQAQRDFALRQRAIGDATQDAAQDVDRAAGLIDRAGDASGRATPLVGGLGSAFDKARTAMIALFAADTFIDFFSTAVERASDLNETMSKSEQIFGDSAQQIDEWGDTASRALGLSKGEALDAAANFGNMFQQLGFSSDAAAEMSKKVVQMSADLGSFNNLDTSDVIERISGAFRGEYDSLQLLIPNINAARVEQEAMAETGKKSVDALTAQEKAAAVLAIVQGDGAKAMGDFARTADGAANSQKAATAAFQESQAEIGQRLLPVWQQLLDLFQNVGVPAITSIGDAFAGLVSFLAPVIEIFGDLPGPIQAAAVAIGAVVLLNGPLNGMASTIFGFAGRLRAATGVAATFGVAAKGAFAFLGGPIGLAIIGLTTALTLFSSSSDDAADTALDLTDVIDEQTGKWKENAAAALSAKVESSGLGEAYRSIGGDAKDLVDAIAGVPGAQDKVNAKISETQTAAKNAGVAVDSLGRVVSSTSYSVQGMTTSFNNTSKAAQENRSQFQDAAKSADLLQQFLDKAGEAQGKFKQQVANTSGSLQKQAVEAQGLAGGISGVSGVLTNLTDDSGKAIDPVKWLASALDHAAEKAKILADQTEAEKMLGDTEDAARDASRALDILSDALDRASGRQVSAEEAAADWNQSIRDTAEAFKSAADATDLNWDALRDWNVAALTASESGASLYDSLNGQYESYKKSTAAAYSAAAANGDVAAAQQAARDKATELRQAFIDNNAEMLGGADKAAALADKLGILDGQTIDPKTFDIVAQDQQARDAVKTAQDAVITNKNFLILADAGAAQAEADKLNATLNQIDGKQVRWFAIGNVTVAVTEQKAATANAVAANHGYAAYDYGFPPGGATGGRVGDLLRGFAGGGKVDRDGRISGPGGGRDDLVVGFGEDGRPLRLSNHETIMNEGASDRWGAVLALMNAGRFADGGTIDGSTPESTMAATLQGAVTAPDPAVIQQAWDQIAGAVEISWNTRIQPVLDALATRNTDIGGGFQALAQEQAVPSWATITTAIQAGQQTIGTTYDQLNTQTQGVGTMQTWLRDTVAAGWASIQATHLNTINTLISGAYTPMQTWLAALGTAQQALAGTTDASWSQIGGTIQGTYQGQIVPAWQGVQGFASATGSFFDGINAGVGNATAKILDDLSQITAAIDEFFGMVDSRGGSSASGDVSVTIPGRARGGLVPGMDTGRDSTIIAARPEEAVMVPQFTRAVGGAVGVDRINRLAEAGQLQGFARRRCRRRVHLRPLQSLIESPSSPRAPRRSSRPASTGGFSTAEGFTAVGVELRLQRATGGPAPATAPWPRTRQAARDFIERTGSSPTSAASTAELGRRTDHPINSPGRDDRQLRSPPRDRPRNRGERERFIQHPSRAARSTLSGGTASTRPGVWAPRLGMLWGGDTLQHQRPRCTCRSTSRRRTSAGLAVGDQDGSIPTGLAGPGAPANQGSGSASAPAPIEGGYSPTAGVERWRPLGLHVLTQVGSTSGCR